MKPKECPVCRIPWKSNDTIYEHFLKEGKSTGEARRIALMYGDTVRQPKHFSINHHGVEIHGEYDGVSYWKCHNCNHHFDRWTMKLTDIK